MHFLLDILKSGVESILGLTTSVVYANYTFPYSYVRSLVSCDFIVGFNDNHIKMQCVFVCDILLLIVIVNYPNGIKIVKKKLCIAHEAINETLAVKLMCFWSLQCTLVMLEIENGKWLFVSCKWLKSSEIFCRV